MIAAVNAAGACTVTPLTDDTLAVNVVPNASYPPAVAEIPTAPTPAALNVNVYACVDPAPIVVPLNGNGVDNNVSAAVPMFNVCTVTLAAGPVPTFPTVATTVSRCPTLTVPTGWIVRLWIDTFPCANTDTALLVAAADVTPTACTASTPNTRAVNDSSACAALKFAVKLKLVAAPPPNNATLAGFTAVNVPPVPFVRIALGDTFNADDVPVFRTVITPVTGAPVPTDDGNAVNPSIFNAAGNCTVTNGLWLVWLSTCLWLLLSVPVACALNTSVPVPCAEYVHWNVCDAFFTSVTGACTDGLTKENPPVPICSTIDGATPTASASPVFVTVNARYTACCRFTVCGDTLNAAVRLAAVDIVMLFDAADPENTVACEFASFPCAAAKYPKIHGLGPDPPNVSTPTYVKNAVAPATTLAVAGTGAPSGEGFAVPVLFTDIGATDTAVA